MHLRVDDAFDIGDENKSGKFREILLGNGWLDVVVYISVRLSCFVSSAWSWRFGFQGLGEPEGCGWVEDPAFVGGGLEYNIRSIKASSSAHLCVPKCLCFPPRDLIESMLSAIPLPDIIAQRKPAAFSGHA